MKKYYNLIFLLCIILCYSCKKESINDLELIVENDTIINKGIGDTCVNILRFSVRNNSDKTYYVNNLSKYKLRPLKNDGIFSDFISLYIFDNTGQEINYNFNYFKSKNAECVYNFYMNNASIYEKKLNYDYKIDYYRSFGFKNFFIHSKETIYFEQAIDLSGAIGYESARIGYADLNKNKQYYAKISLASDSSTYKTSLPRDILKTIKANNAEVFSGRIESVKVPIKFENR